MVGLEWSLSHEAGCRDPGRTRTRITTGLKQFFGRKELFRGGSAKARDVGKDLQRKGGYGGRGTYGGGGKVYSSNFNNENGYQRTDGQGWNGRCLTRECVGTQAVRGRGSPQA